MFKDIKEAKDVRAQFVAGRRDYMEYRKGYDKQDRPAVAEIPHRVDVTASGKDLLPVQMNERGEYFFVVGDVVVENATDALAITDP